MTRYAVIRVPTSGPPALIDEPNVFADRKSAVARIKEIEGRQLKGHHTFLDVLSFEGSIDELVARERLLR